MIRINRPKLETIIRSLRKALCLLVLAGVTVALAPGMSEAGLVHPQDASTETESQSDPPEENPLSYSLEVGGGYGYYPDAGDHTGGQYVKWSAWRPGEYAISLDAGARQGFGTSTAVFGGTFTRNLNPITTVSAGLSTSSGELAPKYMASVWASRPFFDVGFTAGYTRYQGKGEVHADEVFVGLQRWFPDWILGGSLKTSWGDPEDSKVWGGGLGVTYTGWDTTWVGGGFDFGRTRYEELFGVYYSRGFNVGVSHWLEDDSGVNVRFGYGEPLQILGITASWFTEW